MNTSTAIIILVAAIIAVGGWYLVQNSRRRSIEVQDDLREESTGKDDPTVQ